MNSQDFPLRNEQLRHACEDALSGESIPRFFSLLSRYGGLPGPRPNMDLALVVGGLIASHRAKAQHLVDAMANLDEREAPGPSAQAFLLIVAACALGSFVQMGHRTEQAWQGLQDLAGDPRKVARDGVVHALEQIGVRQGGVVLLEHFASWTNGFLQSAVALEVLARRPVLDRTPLQALDLFIVRLDEIINLVEEARRSDERTQGRRRLLDAIAEVLPSILARHQGLLPWLQGHISTQQPELREAFERCVQSLRRHALSDEILDPLRQALDESQVPLRDPTHYKGPTRGRGRKAQRREQRR